MTALAVGGNLAGGDDIVLTPVDAAGTINVIINHVSFGNFVPTGHIFVYGQGGADKITLRAAGSGTNTNFITVPAFLYGEGSGGDHINASGSTANNVLVGHGDKEVLTGGLGRDILIGGTGSATLNAGVGDDILIGGWTNYDIFTPGVSTPTYDDKLAALEAIMAEWGSADSYATRVNDLLNGGGLNGSNLLNTNTVHNSAAVDYLFGNSKANDWFLAGIEDVLSGFLSGDFITTIK